MEGAMFRYKLAGLIILATFIVILDKQTMESHNLYFPIPYVFGKVIDAII